MDLDKRKIYFEIEVQNIFDDTSFYYSLSQELENLNYSSIIIYNLIPYLSLFCVESLKWLKQNYLSLSKMIEFKHKDIINSSRNRIKIFDDRSEDIEQKIRYYEFVIKSQYNNFNYKHKGFLGIIKKLLQCDMGITQFDNRILSSTFTDLFFLGYSETHLDIPPDKFDEIMMKLSGSFGEDIGSYIGFLGNGFKLKNVDLSNMRLITKKDFDSYDVKAKRFLSNIFPTIKNNALRLILLSLLTELNFLKTFDTIVGFNNDVTTFKMKYLTLFHIISSLKKLNNYAYLNQQIDKNSSKLISNLLNEDNIKIVAKHKKFRNALAHYEVRKVPESFLDPGRPLFGFVEYYYPGYSYSELVDMTKIVLVLLSDKITELMDWYPKRFKINCFIN